MQNKTHKNNYSFGHTENSCLTAIARLRSPGFRSCAIGLWLPDFLLGSAG
ncbi:hypothetical protein OpiT1DRAFT_01964 [Opitutaceae bacterium TAV1]|nr:hypothetical protein OpiT1DRAFT_01964 [Opitutaceae bacterium TAV1]